MSFPSASKSICLFLLSFSIITKIDAQIQSDSLAFGDMKRVEHGIRGKLYALPAGTQNLPDFDTMKPMGTVYTTKIDVPTRDWSTGFPGATNMREWFGVLYEATFTVNKAGHYEFRCLSDDGSKLYIDDSLVVNNDGQHGPSDKSGGIDIDNKKHHFRLEYFHSRINF